MIAGLYGKSMFSFVRNLSTVFQGACLHLQGEPFRIPTSDEGALLLLHILTGTSVLSVFWILAILVLICISLMTYDVEHLFMCLFVICVSSLVRCLLKSLAHF